MNQDQGQRQDGEKGGEVSSDYHDAVLVLLLSCAIDASRLDEARPHQELVGPELTAPAPPVAEGEPLYQHLFADEVGEQARPAGQRARILAWMRSMQFSEEQLQGLIGAAKELLRLREEQAAEARQVGEQEQEHLAPVYEDIILGLAGESEPDWEGLGLRLEEARQGVDDPVESQRERIRSMLQVVATWTSSLAPEQIEILVQSRFFLRKRLAPLVNPTGYETVVGGQWDAGDFDSLRFTGEEDEGGGMDLGGLWSSEPYRAHPDDYLRPLQVQAITVMALSEEGVVEAAEVLLGEREPLDFSVAEDDVEVVPGSDGELFAP